MRDLTVDGTVIPQGTPVLAGYSAAGRDEAFHGPDADRFDITRPGGRAVATSPSATAPTTAWAPRSPGWRPPSPWSGSSPVSPTSTSRSPRPNFPHQRSFISNNVQSLPVRLVRQ